MGAAIREDLGRTDYTRADSANPAEGTTETDTVAPDVSTEPAENTDGPEE